jgi:hypothetical protein
MSTIDADLPENSLILGLFKPVVTMEALTDDIVMKYLQLAQDKDAILSADDFLTQIKAKCTYNLAEDPELRISQLVSSYLTTLPLTTSSDQINLSNPDRLVFDGTNRGGKQLEALSNAETRYNWSREAILAALGGV